MELTPHQTHASLALVGFGTGAAMAANVPLAAGCFGGLGVLHLFLLVRLAIADWRYARKRAHSQTRACGSSGQTDAEAIANAKRILDRNS